MKIIIEVDENCDEEEIVIRCKELNSTVKNIQNKITEINVSNQELILYRDKKEYYIDPADILFFEAEDNIVWAHTIDDIFQTKYKLYELEKILPWFFLRISKSSILNTNKIYSITKNITSASKVEFRNTPKNVYVSRSYYKMLMQRLKERRN